MYDLIFEIIGHAWDSSYGSSEQQYIYTVCCVMIIILTVVFIDLIYRVFRQFWR